MAAAKIKAPDGGGGRQIRGLFTRGKQSRYYCQYYLGGRQFVKALRDPDGRPCTTLSSAIEARKRLLRPYELSDEADRRREALAALRTAEEAATVAIEEARPKLRLADAWKRYPYDHTTPKRNRTRRALSAKTISDNKALWQKFVAWAEIAVPEKQFLEDITDADAVSYSKHTREVEGLTGNRHNKRILAASIMYRMAGRRDPFADIDRYHSEPESRVNLERSEIRQLIEGATGELRRLFIIAAYTGLRLGDAVTLAWSDVHMPHNRLIRRTAKTGKTVSLLLHPDLRAELERTPPADRQGFVCPELAAKYDRDPAAISKVTRRAIEGLKLSAVEDGKGRRKRNVSRRGFHSFRHSFITECARGGVPIGQIRDWIGHESKQITEIYEHWNEDDSQKRILAALPALGAGDPDATAPRERLHRLADALPLARVRELVKQLEAISS